MSPIELQQQQVLQRQAVKDYRLDDCREVVHDLYDYTRLNYGETSPEHAQSLLTLGRWHAANGEYAAAEPLLKQAVQIQNHSHASDAPLQQAQALLALAELQLMLVRADEAQAGLQQAEKLVAQHAPEHSLYAEILRGLGDVEYSQERPDAALPYYEQAASRNERQFGMKHVATAEAYTRVAAVYRLQHYLVQARSVLQHTVDTVKRLSIAHHPRIARVQMELAAVHDDLNDFAQAENYYLEAQRHIEKSLGQQHPIYAKLLSRHAYHHLQAGTPEQAIPMLQQALDIFVDTFDENHPAVRYTIQNMVVLMMANGSRNG